MLPVTQRSRIMSQFEQRLPYPQLAPTSFQAMIALTESLYASGLDRVIIDLVFLRVSQINGCAFCVDKHWTDLIALGEHPQRLNSVVTWHEVDFFDARERAVLAWAENFSGTHGMHAPHADQLFTELQAHFSDSEIAYLTFAVASMNAWNTIAISMRMQVTRRY
jgi:AhpD family alkylhydroperoxidase